MEGSDHKASQLAAMATSAPARKALDNVACLFSG